MSEISRAETAAHRQNRMTGRLDHPNRFRTLSGSVVPYDNVPKRQPAWIQIVAPQPKVERNRKPSDFAGDPIPAGENLAPFSGMNRAERRRRLRNTGMLGVFTRDLERDSGTAWANNLEARRRIRRANEAARMAKRYQRIAAA